MSTFNFVIKCSLSVISVTNGSSLIHLLVGEQLALFDVQRIVVYNDPGIILLIFIDKKNQLNLRFRVLLFHLTVH